MLIAFYQPFWFAVLSAILLMFLYLYAKEHGGLRRAIHIWKRYFKCSSEFRRTCGLAFYTMLILFRTLLSRSMWTNPLSDVMGGWSFTTKNGDLTTEPIENLILFIPFIILLLRVAKDKLVQDERFGEMVWIATKITFLCSVSIEILQLFLRLGTFQLSDIILNTVGGLVGGVIYVIGCMIKKRKK